MKKECNLCGENKPLACFYCQKKKRKDGTEYLYYRPDCKECTKKRSREWIQKNPEAFRRANKKYYSTERGKESKREDVKRRRDNGSWYRWYKKNRHRYDKSHRTHEITDYEWEMCKDYFNYSCAYCGISEDEHKNLYKQQLHKEHVDHEGANDLSNCVPSCRSCNSSKHAAILEHWYNEDNKNYDINRLIKIYEWLNEDFKSYIENII